MKPRASIMLCVFVAAGICTADQDAGRAADHRLGESEEHHSGSFIGPLDSIKARASTVPSYGDLNPYGVAVVPEESGNLHKGQVLVSNFNDSMNLQGTGTTIVEISPGEGVTKLFARIDATRLPGPCPGGVGLTTALVVLRSGWVIVGSLPTTNGMAATAGRDVFWC